MSREHAWAQWLGEFLPRDDALNHRTTSSRTTWRGGMRDDGESYSQLRLHSGNPRSLKVRCVCTDCNNGWMSRLEERTKQVLGPMLLGDAVTLSVDDQRLLGRWIDKTIMVKEIVYKEVVTSADQRLRMMGGDSADPFTEIWIGAVTPSKSKLRHTYLYCGDDLGSYLRIDGATLGPFMFFAVSGRNGIPTPELSLDGIKPLKPYVTRIWPTQDGPVPWPTQPMNHTQFRLLVQKWHREEAYMRSLGTPGDVPELFNWDFWPLITDPMFMLSPHYGVIEPFQEPGR